MIKKTLIVSLIIFGFFGLSAVSANAASGCSSTLVSAKLAVGSRGDAVSQLQTFLKSNNYYQGDITGTYGNETAAAVAAFQGQNGLERSGNWGPYTRAKYSILFCASNTAKTSTTSTRSSTPKLNIVQTMPDGLELYVAQNEHLSLTYSSTTGQSVLMATFPGQISTGDSPFYLSPTYPFGVSLKNNGQYTSASNDYQVSYTMSPIQNNVIPAHTTVDFYVTFTDNPQKLMAGSYTASLNYLTDQNYNAYSFPANETNSVSVMGEVSPFISSINSPIGVGGQVNITGVRINSPTLLIDGNVVNPCINSTCGAATDGTSFIFNMPTYIEPGYHSIQLEDRTTGRSNIVPIQVIENQNGVINVDNSTLSVNFSPTDGAQAQLTGKFDVTIANQGDSMLYMISTGAVVNTIKEGTYVGVNGDTTVMNAVGPVRIAYDSLGRLIYQLGPHETERFTITKTMNTRNMLSGMYSESLKGIYTLLDLNNIDSSYLLNAPPNGTNVVAVMGETPNQGGAPVIHGVSAPTQLNINQTGTWTVSASDPRNGNLSYLVDWGEYLPYTTNTIRPTSLPFQQTASFTHSYSQAGTYTQTFTVRNDSGAEARTTTTVKVGTIPVPPVCTTLTRDLSLGSSGADVVTLQTFLTSKGFLTLPAGTPMGSFDIITRSALAAFQASVGLSPADGVAGPNTRAYINNQLPPCPPAFNIPAIKYIDPISGAVGATVNLYGSNFCLGGSCTIKFGSSYMRIGDHRDTSQLTLSVPDLAPGTYPVSTSNSYGSSNFVNFTVTVPTITTVVPPTASLTVNGTHDVTVVPNRDSTNFYWHASNADKFDSNYSFNCNGVTGSSPWGASSADGKSEGVVPAYLAGPNNTGCTYTITYTVTQSSTGKTASDTVVTRVLPVPTVTPPTLAAPTASLTVNGSHDATAVPGQDSLNFSWHATNADRFTSNYLFNCNGVTGSSPWGASSADGQSGGLVAAYLAGPNNTGCTYTITYTVTQSSTGKTASDTVVTKVLPAPVTTPPPVPPPCTGKTCNPCLMDGSCCPSYVSGPCAQPIDSSLGTSKGMTSTVINALQEFLSGIDLRSNTAEANMVINQLLKNLKTLITR